MLDFLLLPCCYQESSTGPTIALVSSSVSAASRASVSVIRDMMIAILRSPALIQKGNNMTSKKLSRFMIAALAVGSSTSALAQKNSPMWDGKESVAAYAKRAKLKPTETIDLGGGVNMELVLVPAGTFVMGSPDSEAKTDEHKGKEPQHKVTLTKPFYMTKYEVTQPQYEKIVGTNPSRNKGDQFPVVDVSWEDAMAFAKKAGEVMKRDVRIPTDAQWEHAARAGTQTAVYTGDDDAAKDKAGWCGANSGGKVHPVGEKGPTHSVFTT